MRFEPRYLARSVRVYNDEGLFMYFAPLEAETFISLCNTPDAEVNITPLGRNTEGALHFRFAPGKNPVVLRQIPGGFLRFEFTKADVRAFKFTYERNDFNG